MALYTNSLNHSLAAMGILEKIFTGKKAYTRAKSEML